MDAAARGGHMRQPGDLQDTHRQPGGPARREHGRQHAVRHLRRRSVSRVHRERDGGARRHTADDRRQTRLPGVPHAG